MENQNYNSLTQKLIRSGILQSDSNESENIFETAVFPEEKNVFIQNSVKKDKKIPKNKKRLNNYDLELLKNENTKYSLKPRPLEIIKRFLNFKQNKITNGSSCISEKILFAFFPDAYRIKLTKEALNKLVEFDVDAKTLFDKTIPYGERENRYENLVKYLKYANEIQTKLKESLD